MLLFTTAIRRLPKDVFGFFIKAGLRPALTIYSTSVRSRNNCGTGYTKLNEGMQLGKIASSYLLAMTCAVFSQ
jgi:hypothetical protein